MLENNIGCWWLETYTDLILSSEGIDILEVILSNISWKKLDDFSAENLTKIKTYAKKGEDGLDEQRSFVRWKYGPCRE